MIPDEIRKGLKFASENDLTRREMEVLLKLLDEPKTNQVIADELKSPKTTIHHIIMRLKLKGLIIVSNRDDNGSNLYELTLES